MQKGTPTIRIAVTEGDGPAHEEVFNRISEKSPKHEVRFAVERSSGKNVLLAAVKAALTRRRGG